MVMKELTVSTYHKGEFFALGFGTTVAMWAVAYFSRLPAVMLPSTILLFLLVLCLFCGGYFAGKYTKHGFRAGIYTGVITALLNLLILGSLLSGEHPNQIVPTALCGCREHLSSPSAQLHCAWLGQRNPLRNSKPSTGQISSPSSLESPPFSCCLPAVS